MSLQVWLPLNGDLHNQGLKNISVSSNNSSVSINGKIGSCMKITSNTDLGYSHDFNTTGVSFGGWFKFNKSEISSVVSNLTYNSTANSPTGNLIGNNYYGGIGLIWTGNNYYSSNNFSSMTIQSILRTNSTIQNTSGFYVDFDVWVHIFLTWDPDAHALNLYKNGILFNTKTSVEFSDGVTKNILLNYNAIWGGNGPSASIPMYCNDIRIYDHALSPLEVKHLAQGLVLHYPLNQGGFGGENLDNFSSMASNWVMESLNGSNYTDSSYGNVIKLVTNNTNQRMYHSVSNLWQSGQVYTVSFMAKADINGRTCNMSRSLADFSPSFTLTTNWERYSGKITSTATPGGGTLSFTINQSGATVYITQIKLEKGDIATPYTPAPSDDLYSQMGLDNNIEYDVSGYGNNGVKNGTFSVTSNTSRYSTSTIFNGNDNAIKIPFNSMLGESTDYTVSVWIYKTSIGTKNYQTILGGPSGFELEARSSTNTSPLFRLHNWGGGTTPYNFNEWTFFTFVRTASDSKLYVNGELRITGTAGSIPSGNYWIGSWSTATSQNYEGLMSDFRIYTTALSADDVMALYKNAGYVDSDGNVYAYEMAE